MRMSSLYRGRSPKHCQTHAAGNIQYIDHSGPESSATETPQIHKMLSWMFSLTLYAASSSLSLFSLYVCPPLSVIEIAKWKQLLSLLVCACYSMLLKPKDTVGHWCITCRCLLEALPLCYSECCECAFINLCVFTRVFSNCSTLSSQGHRSEWRL